MKFKLREFHTLISQDGLFADGDWVESKDQDPNGEVRLVQLADIGTGEFIDKSNRYMTREKAKELRCTFLEPGDILIARMPDPIGRACIFPGSKMPCVTVVDVCIVRPLPDEVNSSWLMHTINSKKFNNNILQFVTGTTRQRISRGNLAKLKIPLPPLTEQIRIAAILDKADSLRRKNQQAIQLADQFLRAVFLDIFGDPVTNPKGWELKPLKELTSKIGSGSTPRGGQSAYVEEGISLIRSLNIHDDKFLHKNLAFITDKQAAALSNVEVEKRDVLLNITGASVCRCSIVDDSILPARVNQHVCIIRAPELAPEYLLHMLISASYKRYLLNIAGAAGATREALTKDQVENLMIPVPPMILQEKFAAIKNMVKSVINKENKGIYLPLFDSLSQKAFAGEL